MKLSETQIKILRELQSGNVIVIALGTRRSRYSRIPRWDSLPTIASKTVRRTSLDVLLAHGLLEAVDGGSPERFTPGERITLSEKGRLVVAAI